jgi:hypothetical protein
MACDLLCCTAAARWCQAQMLSPLATPWGLAAACQLAYSATGLLLPACTGVVGLPVHAQVGVIWHALWSRLAPQQGVLQQACWQLDWPRRQCSWLDS